MPKNRIFTTLPANAIADSTLTGLDLRCLAAISIHDGMSLVKETGAGCYAALSTLARKVGTDMTNFSKSLSKLIRKGYVVKEPQIHDKRRSTLRVVFPKKQNETLGGDKGCGVPDPQEPDSDSNTTALQATSLVGDDHSKNGRIPGDSSGQYISLNEEIYSVESGEKIPHKRRVEDAELKAFDCPKANQHSQTRNDAMQATFAERLLDSFRNLSPAAQVGRIERELRKLKLEQISLTVEDQDLISHLLGEIAELHPEAKHCRQAERLREEIYEWPCYPPETL